jgi:RimJ/RimL family protein N-acetyltransferase
MLGYLFDELRLRRVYLHTLTWNARAQASFTAAGFHRVREVRRGGYDFVYMETFPADVEPQDEDAPGVDA